MGNTQELTGLIGAQIKNKLTALSNTDGLKRTQRWLASQAGLGEVELSNKLAKNDFTKEELENINKVLGTDFN